MRIRLATLMLLVLSLIPRQSFSQQNPPPPPPQYPIKPMGVPPPPPMVFNLSEMKFGAQGIGVQSCMYLQMTNTASSAMSVKKLYVADSKDYSIPSPSQQMLPISVPPNSSVTISVCFKPTTAGDHNSYLALVTAKDSFAVNIQGKGLKEGDLAKLPKVGLTVEATKSKKSKQWLLRVRLLAQSRVTLQIFDALGMLVQTYSMNDLKPEGVFEQTFEGLDKGHLPLPRGTYYVRCVIDEVARNSPQIYTKTVTIK